jgi:hypothetical protein
MHDAVWDVDGTVALFDVEGLEADAEAVDALARLQLAVRRLGHRVHLCNASPELLGLVAFMGLADALPAERPTDDGITTFAPGVAWMDESTLDR